MRIFLLMAFFCLLGPFFGLPIFLAKISQWSHHQCLFHLPEISSQDWIAALVCGERLQNPLIDKLLIDTSLVHLLVISVGHLQMLSWLFEQTERFQNGPAWLRQAFAGLRWLVLILFALMSGFHPPVVRALFAEGLRSLSHFFRWRWNLLAVTTASGILTLLYRPLWIFAVSLYLPWICCLGFCAMAFWRDTRIRRRESLTELLVTATVIQILLVIPLGEFRWEGVFANAFLMPVFGLFLFPVSALTYLFHFLGPVTDFFFRLFEQSLRLLLLLMGSPPSTPLPAFYPRAAWALIAVLSAVIHFLHRERWKEAHDEMADEITD
jgi:ComEC/Rec2-related protein